MSREHAIHRTGDATTPVAPLVVVFMSGTGRRHKPDARSLLPSLETVMR